MRVVSDELEDMELRGDAWRMTFEEVANEDKAPPGGRGAEATPTRTRGGETRSLNCATRPADAEDGYKSPAEAATRPRTRATDAGQGVSTAAGAAADVGAGERPESGGSARGSKRARPPEAAVVVPTVRGEVAGDTVGAGERDARAAKREHLRAVCLAEEAAGKSRNGGGAAGHARKRERAPGVRGVGEAPRRSRRLAGASASGTSRHSGVSPPQPPT